MSGLTCKKKISLSSSSALEPDLDFLAGTVVLTGAGVLSATTPAGVSRGTTVQSKDMRHLTPEGVGGAQKRSVKRRSQARMHQTLSVRVSFRPPTALLQWFSSILLLLAVILLRTAVSAGTCTDPHVKGSATQNMAPGGGRGRGASWRN